MDVYSKSRTGQEERKTVSASFSVPKEGPRCTFKLVPRNLTVEVDPWNNEHEDSSFVLSP